MREGDLIAGRYRLERRAGTGGMGTVFRAVDVEDGRRVAIKTLSDQALGSSEPSSGAHLAERFEREASVLAVISDAAIVRYISHGVSEWQEPYLVMQWVEGQDLASRLNDRGLSSNESLRLALRLAEALSSLHSNGIVHRDVKPANVMLEHGEVERAVLVDLGVARRAGFASATVTGARVGTPSYMAPEQIRDPRKVDGRADVFSLGCILFECLSGRRAFDAEDGLGAIAKILLERAPSLATLRPDLSSAVSAVVASMLERDPADRPFADAALSAALSEALAADAEHDSPPPRLALKPAVATRTEVFGTRAEIAEPKVARRSAAPSPARIPYRKGLLVGRERELSEIAGFVASGARCIWLWGAPGIGKTRLALELCAGRVLEGATSPPEFVELGSARRNDDVLRVFAQALGARMRGAEAAADALGRTLRARGPLICVLDGVDAVSDGVEELVQQLAALAPEARFVMTSRERPRLRASFALEVLPLSTQGERELLTTASRDLSAAAQLFVQALREHGAAPPHGNEDRVDVERIARAVDGVPLALELVAARVPLLGLSRIATDVARPFALREALVGDAQAPITSQIRLSFDSLTEAEQSTLLGCAVFARRFAAEAV
ncbi:MAG TPA: protein kinase, partial [Polyangiaceae bacterium]|nr:protein kinase [Polyangiaceae bacterium]